MSLKSVIYNRLPERLKPVVRLGYYKFIGSKSDKQLHSEFVNDFFRSKTEYERYVDEFERGDVVNIRDEALEEYRQLTGKNSMGAISMDAAQDYYAVTRKLQPFTVVETGVCNGLSTLSILLALHKNDSGKLYSVDYPYRADESLEEFREDTFEKYGGATIPSDKEPGWIIPDRLRKRWDLTKGKSQRELPGLMAELEEVDLFIHDSEHSYPCMMFEYELAYEWLESGGVILSDDINWNEAFSVFVQVRRPEWGKLSNDVGYIRKR